MSEVAVAPEIKYASVGKLDALQHGALHLMEGRAGLTFGSPGSDLEATVYVHDPTPSKGYPRHQPLHASYVL